MKETERSEFKSLISAGKRHHPLPPVCNRSGDHPACELEPPAVYLHILITQKPQHRLFSHLQAAESHLNNTGTTGNKDEPGTRTLPAVAAAWSLGVEVS